MVASADNVAQLAQLERDLLELLHKKQNLRFESAQELLEREVAQNQLGEGARRVLYPDEDESNISSAAQFITNPNALHDEEAFQRRLDKLMAEAKKRDGQRAARIQAEISHLMPKHQRLEEQVAQERNRLSIVQARLDERREMRQKQAERRSRQAAESRSPHLDDATAVSHLSYDEAKYDVGDDSAGSFDDLERPIPGFESSASDLTDDSDEDSVEDDDSDDDDEDDVFMGMDPEDFQRLTHRERQLLVERGGPKAFARMVWTTSQPRASQRRLGRDAGSGASGSESDRSGGSRRRRRSPDASDDGSLTLGSSDTDTSGDSRRRHRRASHTSESHRHERRSRSRGSSTDGSSRASRSNRSRQHRRHRRQDRSRSHSLSSRGSNSSCTRSLVSSRSGQSQISVLQRVEELDEHFHRMSEGLDKLTGMVEQLMTSKDRSLPPASTSGTGTNPTTPTTDAPPPSGSPAHEESLFAQLLANVKKDVGGESLGPEQVAELMAVEGMLHQIFKGQLSDRDKQRQLANVHKAMKRMKQRRKRERRDAELKQYMDLSKQHLRGEADFRKMELEANLDLIREVISGIASGMGNDTVRKRLELLSRDKMMQTLLEDLVLDEARKLPVGESLKGSPRANIVRAYLRVLGWEFCASKLPKYVGSAVGYLESLWMKKTGSGASPTPSPSADSSTPPSGAAAAQTAPAAPPAAAAGTGTGTATASSHPAADAASRSFTPPLQVVLPQQTAAAATASSSAPATPPTVEVIPEDAEALPPPTGDVPEGLFQAPTSQANVIMSAVRGVGKTVASQVKQNQERDLLQAQQRVLARREQELRQRSRQSA